MTGQWLGIHQPQRLDKLVLANTAARIGTPAGWNARAAQVRADGMAKVAIGAAVRWFTPAFAACAPQLVARMIARLREQDREGYAACCAALAEADLRHAAASIAATTLVIAGAYDPVTTVADGEWLTEAIRAAELAVVPASHISNIEADTPFTTHLLRFLAA
jgi:3-oxoadipate enol-lactonase